MGLEEDDELEEEENEEFLLSCDICGQEEGEEEVDENWITFSKPGVFEVFVCPDCASLKENLEKGFGIFLEHLATIEKREAMT